MVVFQQLLGKNQFLSGKKCVSKKEEIKRRWDPGHMVNLARISLVEIDYDVTSL